MGLSDERCFRRSSQRFSAAGMRSAKVTAKALSAGFHRMVHRAWPVPLGSRPLVTRYRHLRAACSVGKCPRTVTARRYLACRDSKLSCQAATVEGAVGARLASFHMCLMMTLAS